MHILTLKHIILCDRPDEQTRTFYSRVQSWMSQWTVENNYHQIVIETLDDEQDALEVWASKFEANFKSAIPEVLPKDGSLRDNFRFVYRYSKPFSFGKELDCDGVSFSRVLADIKSTTCFA